MWNKIKEFFKKYWGVFLAAIVGLFSFILGRNRRRNSILRDAEDRAKQSGQQFAEHRDIIEESRIENRESTNRVESSERITEEIRRTNDTISGAVSDAREQLSNIESSIDERINELRKRKEN